MLEKRLAAHNGSSPAAVRLASSSWFTLAQPRWYHFLHCPSQNMASCFPSIISPRHTAQLILASTFILHRSWLLCLSLARLIARVRLSLGTTATSLPGLQFLRGYQLILGPPFVLFYPLYWAEDSSDMIRLVEVCYLDCNHKYTDFTISIVSTVYRCVSGKRLAECALELTITSKLCLGGCGVVMAQWSEALGSIPGGCPDVFSSSKPSDVDGMMSSVVL